MCCDDTSVMQASDLSGLFPERGMWVPPMSGKSLFIHIGCHKTGTTSIQRTLALNDQVLRHHNLTFFYADYFTGTDKLPDLHSWLHFDYHRGLVPDGMKFSDVKKLARELDALGTDVVVSSENLSFVFDQSEITRLRKALSPTFSNITVICYLRRQDEHAISHHQEGSKLDRRAETDLFGHSTRALPDYDKRQDLYLDYYRRLSMWGDAFGDRNVIVRVFDRQRLRGKDAVTDFFDILGVSDYLPTEDHNVSRTSKQAKVGHLINAGDIHHPVWMVDLVMRNIDGGEKMLPSRREARQYYDRYAESNRLLNARFQVSNDPEVFPTDFDMYPATGMDGWDESSADDVILGILETFDAVFGELTADDLRQAAIALEHRDLRTAAKLMTAAHHLRPEGPLIIEKLAQYREWLGDSDRSPSA